MMRCSGGAAGRRSAAGPGESASSRLCAPGGRAGAAPLVGGRHGVPGRGNAGGVEGVPGRRPVDAFAAPPGVPERRPVEAFDGDIADEAFDGDIDDESFDDHGFDELGAPGRIVLEAFDVPAPVRIDGELVSAPGRIVDESFDELAGPGRFDGAPERIIDESFDGIDVGPLGGVPSRGGDGARDDSLSRVCPAHVSSTGGGGGSAGALSRNTFVDVRSGTPSAGSSWCGGTSTRGDEASCWANGDVMSTVAVGFGSTRVADESN